MLSKISQLTINQFQPFVEDHSLAEYYYLFGRTRKSTTKKFNWEIIGLVAPDRNYVLILTTTGEDSGLKTTLTIIPPEEIRHIQKLEDSTDEWFCYIENLFDSFQTWHRYQTLQNHIPFKRSKGDKTKI